ncbi:MAG: hypothetical protein ACON3Z_12865 [Bradymonadia bacterium]
MKRAICALPLLMMSIGCGADQVKQGPGNAMAAAFAGAPEWVLGCDNYFEGKAVVCGVGSVSGVRNPSLAVSAAEGRGRSKIARSLQSKIKTMLKDYQSTTAGGDSFGKASNDEQHIVEVSKQVTKMSLSGTKKKKHWIGPDGTIHVLMVLDVEAFKNSMSKMQQLDEAVRKAVVERADKAFKELDAQ